jgi:hypothetical protein
MAVLQKGTTFADGSQVTSTNLNNLVDAATFAAGAVDDSTTQLSGGAIICKDGGITPAKLSTGHPDWTSGGVLSATSIQNTPVGSTTRAAGAFTTLAANDTATIMEVKELATITATAPTSTTNFNVKDGAIVYYTSNTSTNWTLNIRGDGSTTLNSLMNTGDCLTITVLATNGSTAYYASAHTIDGSSVTPKWAGASAPTAGNSSSVDSYTYAIFKTGSAAFTVFATQTRFA